MSTIILNKEDKNNNTSKIIIDKKNNLVKKIIDYNEFSEELFNREMFWLLKLQDTNIVPKVLKYNLSELSITMNYCGEPITYNNSPKDVYKQLYNIQIILLKNNCMYNDWKHGNVLVKDNKVYIIDFGWCPTIKEDYTCNNNVFSDLTVKPGGGNFFKNIFDDQTVL